MFEIGQYIVYGTNGVCKVQDITTIEMAGVQSEGLYYILSSITDASSKTYAPVDRLNNARVVLTKEEAENVVNSIKDTPEFDIPNVRLREAQFKESFASCDCIELIKIIKTTYAIKNQRKNMKKRMGYVDAKYFKDAQDNLFLELALVLDKSKDEIEKLFFDIIDNQ